MQEEKEAGRVFSYKEKQRFYIGQIFWWGRLYNMRESFQGIVAFPSQDMVKRTKLFSQLTSHSTKKLKGPDTTQGDIKKTRGFHPSASRKTTANQKLMANSLMKKRKPASSRGRCLV